MSDPDLIAKRLAFVETCLRELRTLVAPAKIETDLLQQRFALHTLQIAIQAALDVASHVVSDERLGEPATNRELFTLLARHGWLPVEHAARLGDMAGFRNIVVHGYVDVDLGQVRRILEHDLSDLDDFVTAVRARLA